MLWAVGCGTALRLDPLVRHLSPRSRRSPSPLLAPRRPTGGAPCRADTGACDRDRQQLQARATLCSAAAPEEWPAASACHPVSASVRRAMAQAAVRPSLDIVQGQGRFAAQQLPLCAAHPQ